MNLLETCEETRDYSEGCCCDVCVNNGFGNVYESEQVED